MEYDMEQLPYSEEAEQATLGGLIIDIADEAWDKVADVISESDFYYPAHRLIYSAVARLVEQQRAVDVITLGDQLDSMKQLEKAGGKSYLAHLALNTPTSANVRAYAQIVRDFSLCRGLINAGTNIVSSARNTNGASPQELLDKAETEIFAIAERSDNRRDIWTTAKQTAKSVSLRLQALSDPEQRAAMVGLMTPWQEFNNKTNGLQKGDLIVVAGRPSMGKTTFAMNMASHIAGQGKAVAIFSVEMGADQLTTRVAASLSRVSLGKFQKGEFNQAEWTSVSRALQAMSNQRLFIDESATLSPIDVRSRARRLMRQEPDLALIVIDYLQLMTSGQRTESRVQEVAQISRSLKALAKELNIPVIALSQLSRKNMDRQDKKPILSDLRESGAIEQDADLICFVHREEMVETEEAKKAAARGKAEIIIGKHRNGETGTINLNFQGAHNLFTDEQEEITEFHSLT